MRNSFNFLLIALICMDSSYLIGWIIEAFRKSFHVSGRKEERGSLCWGAATLKLVPRIFT